MKNNETLSKIHNRIAETCNAVTWDYNKKHCGVDPYYDFKNKAYHFPVWYGDKDADFSSVDEVMNAPFFDGKTIAEIIPDMEYLDGI